MDIDIKGDTDGKGMLQIKQDVEYEFMGDRFHSLETQEIFLAMDQFSITSAQPIEDCSTSIIMRSPAEDLMKRKKHKHLTFDQKLYIYNCSKEGEQVNQIWKRIGISLITAKKIIKCFQTNHIRSSIYTKIRWK